MPLLMKKILIWAIFIGVVLYVVEVPEQSAASLRWFLGGAWELGKGAFVFYRELR